MSETVLDFDKIHADFRPRIQRYVARLVGDDEAEDLTQEIFVRISKALHTFRGESTLSTWVYRIATNAAVDRLRSPSFRRTLQNEARACPDADEPEREDVSATGQETYSLEHQLFRKERYDCYCAFVENLPPNYRTVVALSELGELAVSEIAEVMGLSLDVVKIRLHRGRVRLLQELKARCRPEDWL